MATWKEVKDFLRSSFTMQEDDGDFFQMTCPLGQGRSQLVYIDKAKSETNSGTDIWARISSPIGNIEPDELDDALEMAAQVVCGGLVKVAKYYYFRHSVLIDDMSKEEFLKPFFIVLKAADAMEKQFVGGDSF